MNNITQIPGEMLGAFKNFVSDHMTKKISFDGQEDPSQVASINNNNGQITHTLKSGQQAIMPPADYSSAFQSVYEKNPDLPKGHLESLAMQESSMGTNKANLNLANGKFGYVFGLTPGAFADTKTQPKNANTLAGAANVAAKYYQMRSQIHDETGKATESLTKPSDIYNRYTVPSAHPDTQFNPAKYDSLAGHYAQLYDNSPIANK